MDLLNQIREQCTPERPLTSLDHIQHVMEGYRAYIRGDAAIDGCPYSPGSAREHSWSVGVRWAKEDQRQT